METQNNNTVGGRIKLFEALESGHPPAHELPTPYPNAVELPANLVSAANEHGTLGPTLEYIKSHYFNREPIKHWVICKELKFAISNKAPQNYQEQLLDLLKRQSKAMDELCLEIKASNSVNSSPKSFSDMDILQNYPGPSSFLQKLAENVGGFFNPKENKTQPLPTNHHKDDPLSHITQPMTNYPEDNIEMSLTVEKLKRYPAVFIEIIKDFLKFVESEEYKPFLTAYSNREFTKKTDIEAYNQIIENAFGEEQSQWFHALQSKMDTMQKCRQIDKIFVQQSHARGNYAASPDYANKTYNKFIEEKTDSQAYHEVIRNAFGAKQSKLFHAFNNPEDPTPKRYVLNAIFAEQLYSKGYTDLSTGDANQMYSQFEEVLDEHAYHEIIRNAFGTKQSQLFYAFNNPKDPTPKRHVLNTIFAEQLYTKGYNEIIKNAFGAEQSQLFHDFENAQDPIQKRHILNAIFEKQLTQPVMRSKALIIRRKALNTEFREMIGAVLYSLLVTIRKEQSINPLWKEQNPAKQLTPEWIKEYHEKLNRYLMLKDSIRAKEISIELKWIKEYHEKLTQYLMLKDSIRAKKIPIELEWIKEHHEKLTQYLMLKDSIRAKETPIELKWIKEYHEKLTQYLIRKDSNEAKEIPIELEWIKEHHEKLTQYLIRRDSNRAKEIPIELKWIQEHHEKVDQYLIRKDSNEAKEIPITHPVEVTYKVREFSETIQDFDQHKVDSIPRWIDRISRCPIDSLGTLTLRDRIVDEQQASLIFSDTTNLINWLRTDPSVSFIYLRKEETTKQQDSPQMVFTVNMDDIKPLADDYLSDLTQILKDYQGNTYIPSNPGRPSI